MNKYLLISILSFLGTACSSAKFIYDGVQDWQQNHPDNFIEEKVEDFIRDKTGKDIDLSPISGPERETFKLPHIRQIQEADKMIAEKTKGKKINKTNNQKNN